MCCLNTRANLCAKSNWMLFEYRSKCLRSMSLECTASLSYLVEKPNVIYFSYILVLNHTPLSYFLF